MQDENNFFLQKLGTNHKFLSQMKPEKSLKAKVPWWLSSQGVYIQIIVLSFINSNDANLKKTQWHFFNMTKPLFVVTGDLDGHIENAYN